MIAPYNYQVSAPGMVTLPKEVRFAELMRADLD